MKVYRTFPLPETLANPVITLGTFDGVHLGHLKIIEQLKEKAKVLNGTSVVITFDPHPRQVLFPFDENLKLLNTLDERIVNIERQGIDVLIVQQFTKEFSRLTAMEFVRDYLINQIGLKELVIGHDHHFGRNREGSIESLKEMATTFGFGLDQIPAQLIDEVSVSSTKIRNAITDGNMLAANQYLGYVFEFSGKVIAGDQLGKKIGFPTANIELNTPFKIVPGTGVYAVKTFVGQKWYKGVMNIGYRPTVSDQNLLKTEVHIFDFDEMIYGETIKVAVVEKIRNEIKFNGIEELKMQINTDCESAHNILSEV